MALNHVAQRTSFVKIFRAAFNALSFRMRDLHVINIISIPKGFHHDVCKAEHQHVLYRGLAQVVVNAKYLFFAQMFQKLLLQDAGTFQVIAERLFHHYTFPAMIFIGETHFSELAYHGAVLSGRNRHVKNHVLGKLFVVGN